MRVFGAGMTALGDGCFGHLHQNRVSIMVPRNCYYGSELIAGPHEKGMLECA